MEESKNNQPQTEFVYQGCLEGHNNWVTSIVAGYSQRENEDSPVLISGSRDKSLIIWKLFEEQSADGFYGQPYRQLTGHNHFVTDLALSNENQFVISSSWDKSLRLWDLRQGKTSRIFNGHTREVFSVAFSPDNRQIISAGADREIKLWNTLADCKFTSEKLNHSDWVSCVRYSPQHRSQSKHQTFDPYFASVGWDGRLKIWSTNIQVRYTFKAHEGMISSVSISPNGKYLASGGKDKKLNVWDIIELNNVSRTFDAGAQINQISFNPKLQWVAVGTEKDIKVWDLMNVSTKPISVLEIDLSKSQKEGKGKRKPPQCTSLTWNSLGKKLFAGYADGGIRVWHVITSDKENAN